MKMTMKLPAIPNFPRISKKAVFAFFFYVLIPTITIFNIIF